MKSKTVKAVELGLLVGLIAALMWSVGTVRTRQEISDKVVRLHVLANSDSEEDQALKYRVRDAVLGRLTALMRTSEDRSQAEGIIRGQLLELEELARQEITAAGYDYPVTAQLQELDFPTREYESFTLPAGEYLALQLVIGEGAGQNWWCVVFPPLCTAAAAEVPASALAAGFSEEEVRFITEEEGYVLKFKALEWLEALKEKLA
ncbi:MAG: stage II sporulation protein R [Oscillibacter sp.]|nr:stage II sporulation protein R [Oscillibacter sp.]